MQLLGPYNSNLQTFHYQELLDLYEQQIAKGGFAGNSPFNTTELNNLIQQSKDFTNLPLPSAGQRVSPDSINTPLNILTARYNALASEAEDYTTVTGSLISILQKDTTQLDELLSAADLLVWVDKQPILFPSTQFSWDYGMSVGPSSLGISKEDPANGVIYPTNCPTSTYLDITDGEQSTGLVAPANTTIYPIRDLAWIWTPMTTGEQSEDIYGSDWTELNLLEDAPIINYLPVPAIQTLLPLNGDVTGIFSFQGTSINGSLPIYVQTSFVPRRNNNTLVPINALSDGGFENGGGTWTFGKGWSLGSAGNAHSGTHYASKTSFTVWSSVTTYHSGDLVSYLGYEYISNSTNTNSLPNLPNSVNWSLTGVLRSQIFPISLLNNIYVELWIRNLSANGIVTVSLVCLDANHNVISPPVTIPGISSAEQYIFVSEILQAINQPNVAAGCIQVSVFGQTFGSWVVDDFRVHLPQNISNYFVNQDTVDVYTPLSNSTLPGTVYFNNQDFVVDDISNITFMNLIDGTPLVVRFTERYPAYQCSVDEKVWSPTIMLDPNRPYPDNTVIFDPIVLGVDASGNRTLFPVTDEQGVPTGITMQVIGQPSFPYYISVTTPANPQFGATALLQIDFITPAYMNGLTISPFSTYPIKLVKVQVESFTSTSLQTIGTPNALLDRPMTLTFPSTLVSTIFLTCYQESYNLSEYQVQPPDQLQRDVLTSLQTVLPFNIRTPSRAVPTYFRGAQYTMGLENIAGINSVPVLPGVFVAGPHKFKGCPDVIRFDVQMVDATSINGFSAYLCWVAYNSSGVVINSNTVGVPIIIGTCVVFPFPSPSILNRSTVDHVDISMKFVFRNADVVLQRYLLQVSSV